MVRGLQHFQFSYRRLASVLTYLVPLGSVVGTVSAHQLGYPTFAIVSLYATVPAVLASGVHFASNSSMKQLRVSTVARSSIAFRLSVALYFFTHAGAVLVAATSAVRPISYYALVGATAGFVVLQTLWFQLSRPRISVILGEAGILLMTVVWSVTLKYHYFFARTDVFPQHRFIQSLLEIRHVTAAFGEYQPFPLWHLFIGFQTLLFDGVVSPLRLMFITTGALFGLATIAMYYLAVRFGFSQRTGLIAAIGMCLHPFTILYGMYALPRSVTSVLLLLCLLLLLVNDTRSSVLYLAFITAIAVYHTVTLPFVFITLGVYYVAERVLAGYRETGSTDSRVISTYQLLSIPVVQVIYWGIAAPELVQRIIDLATESSDYGVESPSADLTTQFIEAPYHELANYLPFGFILLFVLFGVLRYSQRGSLSRRAEALLVSAMALCVVSFPGPVLLVSVVSNITPDNIFRFAQYTYPFILIAFGAGVTAAVDTKFKHVLPELKIAVVVLLLCTGVFIGVSNDFVASDNPLVERDDFYTFYLSESETEALEAVATTAGQPLTSDYIGCRYVDNPGDSECEIIQANPVTGELHMPPDSVLVIRHRELRTRPLSIYPTTEPVANPPYSNNRESLAADSPVWDALVVQHRVFDSPEVTGYTSANTTG